MSDKSSTAGSQSTRAKAIRVSLISYGHANGPIVRQRKEAPYHKDLAYNIRHLPNPPRNLRTNSTGLSRRLQKEFLRNDNVEAFLLEVQEKLQAAIEEAYDQLIHSTLGSETQQDPGIVDEYHSQNAESGEDAPVENFDVDIFVTICCEEGRHRSVAFVEELARRLAVFKHGDRPSQYWKILIDVKHRDIANPEELGGHLGQHKLSNKAQAKSRQQERNEKGNRHTSHPEYDY
ncbi:hypothetical protein N7509_012789 [Penicillium cosmopolitanum]|uniref:Uncharacterized protein n=1 Tax=Penicillium cosmopolitanum TaxID=1131564 RepID=A0A9W9SC33_9EURO|nr:uncharacterized protein N7509_012789 [Penicillium cosmopolitanum]KAJ5375903.1 hypothetical protein N7509_012789 [Penicillium cosmopolitanum]